jgi:ribosomal protein S18 acetylase RimI-like enzyme
MITFEPIAHKNAREIAKLHISCIRTGFISSLGINFVKSLYEAISQSKDGFGFVVEENSSVLGFVAFATNINKLYRSVILKKGPRFAFLLTGKMFSLKRIRKMLETLFYAYRTNKLNLPSSELLALVIAPSERRKGLATQLLKAGFQQCQKQGIEKIKVLVGADNEPANKFYQKYGFELVVQINNHGVLSNIYVAKTGME